MITLRYLPINAAWAFLFGADIATASIVEMDGRRLFDSRDQAMHAANRAGLKVDTAGVVS